MRYLILNPCVSSRIPLMPICLAASNHQYSSFELVSYGQTAAQAIECDTDSETVHRQLIPAHVTDCNNQMDGYFCTEGAQTLPSDSGGALTYGHENKTYLAGITIATSCSYRADCPNMSKPLKPCSSDERPRQKNVDLRPNAAPSNDLHLLTYYPTCNVTNHEQAMADMRTFNNYIMYRHYLHRNNLHTLSNDVIKSKRCRSINKYTKIRAHKPWVWNGVIVKFTAEFTKATGYNRKFIIEEGYNGSEFVVYVSQFGKRIFEIRQPNRKFLFIFRSN